MEKVNDCCDAKEKEERTAKLKTYLWCSEKTDKDLENFAHLGDAVKKSKNQTLTKAYFHPNQVLFQQDIKKLDDINKLIIDCHVAKSISSTPPPWFVELTKKQVDKFSKLYELVERPQTASTEARMKNIIVSLNLGLNSLDLIDLKDIYEIKNFNNLDFEEFIYSLASLDRIKKIVTRADDSTDQNPEISNTQAILYTVLIQFTVAACCVCNNFTLPGLNPDVRRYFECNVTCMDRLSSCIYDKLNTQFSEIPNFSCSPYYHSLKYFKQAMNTCSKNSDTKNNCKNNSSLNPYVHYMLKHKGQECYISEDVVQGVFATYTRNGCIITSLPNAQLVPLTRMLIGRVSIYEPLCCSAKRRDYIQKSFMKYKGANVSTVEKKNKVKELQMKKLRLAAPRPKIKLNKPCSITKDQISCFTPAVYTKVIQKARELDLKNRKLIFEAEASRNRIVKYQLDFTMFPNNMGEHFKGIFELYNPTDAKYFSLDMSSEAKQRNHKINTEKDPDVFK